VRVGLRKILEAEPQLTVVGEAADGEDAITETRRLRPDLVLILAPAVTRTVIEEFARQPPATVPAQPPAVAELTPREREVLDLLARGLSNPEICERLVISEATTKTHVARILQKLDLRDRIQAVIYAYESRLVAPGTSA
jgi:DNA-binding NarL/FixJ family response regulator